MTKILVVEDDVDQLKPLVKILEKRGYQVIAATNGVDGYECVVKNNPDIVIIDPLLVYCGDQIQGFELIERIRNNQLLPYVGIMTWTSIFIKDVDEISALNSGADDFVRKSIDYGVFLARIERLIEHVSLIRG